MKRIFPIFLISLYALIATAVPAKRERCLLTLANGTTIEATSMGDELMHFYLSDDGRPLLCDNDGIAHFVEADSILQRREAKASKRRAARAKRMASRRKKVSETMTGSKRGLVILIQFPDVPFRFTQNAFHRFFNEKGYQDDINFGSVRDYFLDASYGQFEFTFDIIGPITMSQPLSYYGGNNANGDDKHPAVMVAEAIKMIDDEVDFSQYDWDGDNVVEQVFVVHSGYDEAQSRVRNDIWSHAWTLTEAVAEGDGNGPVMADGVYIDSYATSSELRGRSGTEMAGIGTACHEFSHCFGLPDFYDTQGYSFGMYSWDIMDYGEYNGEGGTPAGFTSYERMFCGWLQPIELAEPTFVTDMPAITSQPIAYILRNSGNENEYYLLENRQQEAWDKYLDGHGLIVLHVDYDSDAWQFNTVNVNRNHQRMTIVPADNRLYRIDLPGDPWPGQTGATELSDATLPAWGLYYDTAEGDKLMNHSLSEITEHENGHISFTFDEEALGIEEMESGEDPLTPFRGNKWKIENGKWKVESGQIVNRKSSNSQMVNGKWSNGKCFDLSGRQIVNRKSLNSQMVNGKWSNGKCSGSSLFIINGKKYLIPLE